MSPAPPRVFYGWVVVAVAFLAQFVATGFIFYSFSVVMTSLADEFAAGQRTPILAVQLSMSLSGMLLGPMVGRWIGRGYVRGLMTWGALATGVGLVAVANATALWQLHLIFATLISFGAVSLTTLTGTPLVVSWFEARRARALGISQLGASLGGAVMAPLAALLAGALAWRGAYQVLGVAAIAVAPVIWFLVVARPEQRGLRPDGVVPEPGAAAAPEPSPMPSARAALREPNLWWIALVTGTAFMVSSALLNHIVAYGTDAGFTSSRAALLASLLSGGAALGKLVFGWLCDRVGEITAFVTSNATLAAGLLLLLQLDSYALTAGCALFVGICLGGALPVSGALMARAFGRDQVGPMMGLMMPIVVAVQLLGPISAAWINDVTGSYRLAFVVFSALLLASCLALRQVRLPSGREVPTASSAVPAAP